MSSKYDLKQALGRCDKLESPLFPQDCWQIVDSATAAGNLLNLGQA